MVKEKIEKLTFDSFISAVNASPLEEDIQELAIAKFEEPLNKNELERVLDKGKYMAPEINYEGEIANIAVDMLTPLLMKYNVEQSIGRDLHRHIYVAIGGRNEVNFEV